MTGSDAPATLTRQQRRLLTRVVDHMLESGSATSSLRSVANEIGTSHRMLIYHFGSQDGLIAAVITEVEERQRAALVDLAADADAPIGQLSLAFWRRFLTPQLRAVERLFFQLYLHLLERGNTEVAARLINAWYEPVIALLTARGYTRAQARRITRLGMAVYRGLLLELLATGDERGADAAMRLYVESVFGDTSV